MTKRIIFFGTGDFALPILKKLFEKYSIISIVTQPDKQKGRGRKKTVSDIKKTGIEFGLEILQPEQLSDQNFRDHMNKLAPEIIVVAAYGKIVPKWILDLPSGGCLNVHASLLPRWRGASPIQTAILEGDNKTGVTIMLMDEGLDTGPILSQRATTIELTDTAGALTTRLSLLGAELLIETLTRFSKGEIIPIPQKNDEATHCKLIKKENALLDFNKPSHIIERKIRAYNPWPVCFMDYNHIQLRIFKAEISFTRKLRPFERGIIGKNPAVGTADQDLIIQEVQMPGKKVVSGRQFLNGARDWLRYE